MRSISRNSSNEKFYSSDENVPFQLIVIGELPITQTRADTISLRQKC